MILLAKEFGIEADESVVIRNLIKRIAEAPDFDENLACMFAERIKGELVDQETREREDRIRREEREFKLEKLRISSESETASTRSENINATVTHRRTINLRDVVPKFDAENIDITLFLALFERQA